MLEAIYIIDLVLLTSSTFLLAGHTILQKEDDVDEETKKLRKLILVGLLISWVVVLTLGQIIKL